MNITICVLTYNRISILKNLLKSLQTLRYPRLEIIVIDNHSQDGTGQFIKENYPELIYYCTNHNIGVSARNLGLKNANGDLIVTIDDDISDICDEDLSHLASYFNKNKFVGALNFKVIDSKSGEICNWVHHKKSEEYANKEFSTYEISEGAVAFRTAAIEIAGPYPEYFFLSHEGPDLAFRILNSGFDVRYSNLITVKHSHAEEGRKPWYRYYYDTRNQFYVAIRNLPIGYSIKFLLCGCSSLFIFSVRDGFLKFWSKGIIDGLKGLNKYAHHRNVLSSDTMKKIHLIDNERPSLFYMAKKRMFRKEIRL